MAARVTIMAGGTGGHVYPALAVAHELASRGWQVSWLGTRDSFEARLVPMHGFALDAIAVFRLRGEGLASLPLAPFRMLRALVQAYGVLRRQRPQVVLGLGGFVTGPGGLVSWLSGVPLVVHEQNAIPGMTNRWLARVARRVLEAFPGSFPSSAGAVPTGNPVRAEIAALPEPGPIDPDRPLRLLVVGGSLGALALNECVPAALAQLTHGTRPEVRHQAGPGKAGPARDDYRRLGIEAEVSEFLDDMAEAYAWSDLVICRAGALTVSELMAAGRPSVLVPYPFAVDDHQTVNAGFLADAQAAILMPQGQMNPDVLAGVLRQLLRDRPQLHSMAVRAYALAQRDATARVADVCEEMAA